MVLLKFLLLALVVIEACCKDSKEEQNDEDPELLLLQRILERAITEDTDLVQIPLDEGVIGKECQPLAHLLEKFVVTPHWSTVDDYLKKASKGRISIDDFWEITKLNFGGLDLQKSDDRHRLACMAYNSSSVEDLLKKLGLPALQIENYKLTVDYIMKNLGGKLAHLKSLVQLISEYSSWMVSTNYPNLPLIKNVTLEEVEGEVRSWISLFNSIKGSEAFRTVFYQKAQTMLLPIKFTPEYAALAITRVPSTKHLLDILCFTKNDYAFFVNYDIANLLRAWADIGTKAVHILNHLEESGFTFFKFT